MYLTAEEEKILDGEQGETLQKSMEILVAIGKIFDADRLIPIKSAQVSGVSYQNIGDSGIEWFENLKGKVRVPSLINPAGMDLDKWKEMGIESEFARKQLKIISVFRRLGFRIECTCTPYYILTPEKGDHIAWAESSAVIYANAVIGAMTNREGGPSALAAAMVGKTPRFGMHIKEKRAPHIRVEVNRKLKDHEFPKVGYWMGKEIENKIPLINFKGKVTDINLRDFGAALASTGGQPIFHVEGVTPEWKDFHLPEESIYVEDFDVESGCSEADLVAIGCPHLSGKELRKIAQMVSQPLKKDMWIFTSRFIKNKNMDAVAKLEKMGAKVFTDTCMVVSPATRNYRCIMVNSGKAFCYLPKLASTEVIFKPLKECIQEALGNED
jgi:hypothetical protein